MVFANAEEIEADRVGKRHSFEQFGQRVHIVDRRVSITTYRGGGETINANFHAIFPFA
jgi:hypothetical protein